MHHNQKQMLCHQSALHFTQLIVKSNHRFLLNTPNSCNSFCLVKVFPNVQLQQYVQENDVFTFTSSKSSQFPFHLLLHLKSLLKMLLSAEKQPLK